ncbi:MAG: deoxyribonuclease IV [Methanomassiliicoccales archaeon]
MLLGAHVGIAGGYTNALAEGEQIGADVIQIFTRNQMQWKAKPLQPDQASDFRAAVKGSRLKAVVAHASYLLNFASPDSSLRSKSIEAALDEIHRCELLGVGVYIFHPGSHSSTSEEEGIQREAESLKTILDRTEEGGVQLALEGMAGQGDTICHSFESIAEVLRRVESKRQMVCLDTCHLFAAGYDMSTAEGVRETLGLFKDKIGMGKLAAIHLNDSKGKRGSRLDRHQNIGKGEIGIEGFKAIVHMKGISRTPMILETPNGDKMYSKEIRLLRRL